MDEPHTILDGDAFAAELDEILRAALGRLREAPRPSGMPPGGVLGVKELLLLALKAEIEAVEEAAMWLVGERITS